MRSAPIAALACVALLGGCAGLPSKPAPARLAAAAPLGDLGLPAGPWPRERWWRRYDDATLDELIRSALASSPSLATARARFDAAREDVRVAGAAAGAHVDLDGSLARQRLSDNGLLPHALVGFSWYDEADLGLRASYTFDWWGKRRAAVEAAADQARAAQAERADAALALEGGVAEAYFGWQADENRLAVARAALDAALAAQAIAAARVGAGLDPVEDLHRAELDVAGARVAIASIEGSARLRVVALAALVGRPPSRLPPLVARPLPGVAGTVPADAKIDLIARRPDIVASRWRVDAAERSAQAARAEFFPDVSIGALAGLSSIDVGKLMRYASRDPQASLALHLPIFDAGLLRGRYGATRARLRGAVADYDATVVAAARDVAAQAATLDAIAAEKAQRALEVRAAERLRASAAARARRGISDRRAELAAETALLAQRDAMVQLDAAALSADIALQRALGGGYGSAPRAARLQSTDGQSPP